MGVIFSDSENASLLDTAIRNYEQAIYPGNVFLAHVDRSPLGGSPHPVAIKTAGAIVNGSFSQAIAGAREITRLEAKVNERLLYAIGYTPGPGVRSSKGGGKKAIVDLAADCENDTKMRGSLMLEKMMLSSTGYSEFAKVSAHTGTTGAGTLTLTNAADALFIQVGDKLAAKDVASTATLRTGYFTVTGVDSQTGIITGTAGGSWDSSAGSGVDGAVIGFYGAMENTTAMNGIIGLPGWLNRTSVDVEGLTAAQRAANPQATSGWYSTGALGVRDSINLMANQTFNVQGAKPSMVIVGTNDFQELQDDLGDRVVIESGKGTVDVNFDGIRFLTAKGKTVKDYCSPALQKDRYMIDPSTWHLLTPQAEIWQPLANYGDRGFRSLENSDALRLDLVCQAALACSFPMANARYVRT